jgi:FixJ family two-component response regulator
MTALPLVAVIEDDLPTQKALIRVLRAGGFEPLPYSCAEDFLASPPHRFPVCLVLDIRLTGMSGLELLRKLKALGSRLSVIVMTALDDSRVRQEAYDLGCVGYLSKVADSEALLEMIRSLSRGAWPSAQGT